MNQTVLHSDNYNFTTKKLKIAFKRWNKKCKINGITDIFNTIYMENALFMIAISQKRQNFPEKTFDEIIKEVQEQHDSMFEKKQQNQLAHVEKFATVQRLSEKEKTHLILNIKAKLAKEALKYEEQRKINLKLFDYKYDKGAKPDYTKPKEIIKQLTDKGYKVHLIDNLKVINAIDKKIYKVAPVCLTQGFDIVTSGTFYTSDTPLGTIICKEGDFECKHIKTPQRGGLAILKSGLIKIAQCDGNSIQSVKEMFCDEPVIEDVTFHEISEKDDVSEFLGGGALLIKEKRKISGDELYKIQNFDQTPSKQVPQKDGSIITIKIEDGLEAGQLRKTYHIILAEKDELVYLAYPLYGHIKNGRDIQNDFYNLNFSYVIKFDGGKGLYITPNPYSTPTNEKNKKYEAYDAGKTNLSGLAYKVAKL